MDIRNNDDERGALMDLVLEVLSQDKKGRLGFGEEGQAVIHQALEEAQGRGGLAGALRAVIEIAHVLAEPIAEGQLLEIAENYLPALTEDLDARDDRRNRVLAERAAALAGRRDSTRAPRFGAPKPQGTERAANLQLARGGRIRS